MITSERSTTICRVTKTLLAGRWSGSDGGIDSTSAVAQPSWIRRGGFVLILIAVFALGSGIVFYDLGAHHGLYALTEYDDGVYFGATMHFVQGQLPYRSFVMVQPPGITIILAPIALLVGPHNPRAGLAISRILTGTFVGLDALLIAVILRHKGLSAAFVGGTLFAIYPPGYSSDHTLMLEPYLIFFCLLAVALAFSSGGLASDRRLLLAGLALGFAGAIKLFAAAIALGFIFVLLFRHRKKLSFLIFGSFLGFVLPCLAFFVGAPHGFIHDVISSQFTRTTSVPTPFRTRLTALVGLNNIASPKALSLGPDSPWPWLGVSLLGSISLAGTLVPALRRKATTFTWFVVVAALLAFAMVCIPQQFYTHYCILSDAFFALVVGAAVGSFVSGTGAFLRARANSPRTWTRAVFGTRVLPIAMCVLGITSFVFASTTVTTIEARYQASKMDHFGDPGKSLDQAIPAGSCVLSDAIILLVIANRMNFSPSCPVMVDSTGTWLAYDAAHPPQRNRREPKDPALVALWQQLLSHADYAVFAGKSAFRVPFTPALSQWFNDRYAVVAGAAPITFKRRAQILSNVPATKGVIP